MPIDTRLVKWDESSGEAPSIDPRMIAWDKESPTENIGGRVSNFAEGAGLAIKAPFIGGGNLAGIVPDERVTQFKQEVSDNSGKPGGFGGQVFGGGAVSAPLMMIPGAQGIGAQTAIGGLYGLTYPAENNSERAMNVLSGGAGSILGYGLGKGINSANSGALSAAEQKAAAEASKNATRDEMIRQSIGAGYTFPPSTLKPSMLNNIKESIAGKYATEYEASTRNQQVTDALARKAANLADDASINPDSLKAARDAIKKPYQEIAGLGMQKQLDELDRLRTESQKAWKEYDRQGTRSAYNDYNQFKQEATALENKIEQVLSFKKRPELIDEFRNARRQLAMNHDVENALIEGSGSVDARVIGRATQRGDKLSDELKTIGEFANNYPRLTRPEKQMGSQGVSKLSAGLGSLLAGGGGAMAGPAGIAAGALPFIVPPLMKSGLLRKGAQMSLVPSYGPSGMVMVPGYAAKSMPLIGSSAGVGLLNE